MSGLRAREANDHQVKLRAASAMQLRITGHTYEEIARKCGFSNKVAAYRAVNRYRETMVRDSVQAVMDYQADLILKAIVRCEDILESGRASIAERMLVQRELTALLKRQAELLGLDKPASVTGAGSQVKVILQGVSPPVRASSEGEAANG